MTRYLAVFPFLILFSFLGSCKQQTKKIDSTSVQLDSLDYYLKKYNKTKNLPGFVISKFTQDSILFSEGYGYADITSQKPYNPKTVQMLASVSKLFISVALMKLVEKDSIDLDVNINDYLPYKVVNPNYPDVSITIRHLATHTASFNDSPNGGKGNIFDRKLRKENWRPVWHPHLEKYNKNIDMPLKTFLFNIFSKQGDWYTEESFYKERPGSYYNYSNYGTALLAYIIELVSQKNYKEFTKEEIFSPLKMKSTGWNFKEVDTINHITYYNDNYKQVPQLKIIPYPDGGLYSNVEDMTKFLQEMMKGYYGKSNFLKLRFFQEMMNSQSKLLETNTGLIWDLDNDCCIGHSGNDFGIATMVYFDKRDQIGRIVFSNIDIQQENQEDTFYSIFNELFRVY